MGVSVKDRNIDSDRAAEAEYKRLNGAGVPLIVIGESIIRGYVPQAIAQALEDLKSGG